MSNFKVDTQVPSCDEIYLIDGRPYKVAIADKTEAAIGAAFTDATLPDASGLVDGLIAYNADQEKLMVTLSGSWV